MRKQPGQQYPWSAPEYSCSAPGGNLYTLNFDGVIRGLSLKKGLSCDNPSIVPNNTPETATPQNHNKLVLQNLLSIDETIESLTPESSYVTNLSGTSEEVSPEPVETGEIPIRLGNPRPSPLQSMNEAAV